MRKAKRENQLKKIALTALILGIISPMAWAEAPAKPTTFALPAAKEGLGYSDLNKIVKGLKVIKDPHSRTIKFAGEIPERCAKSMIPMDAPTYSNGAHILKISMPNCDQSFQKSADDVYVDLADVIADIELPSDEDGKIFLQYYKGGSRNDPDMIQHEVIPGIEHISEATQQNNEHAVEQDLKDKQAKLDRQAEAEANLERLNALKISVADLCRKSDYVGLGAAIEAHADLLGEMVPELLEGIKENQRKNMDKALAKSKDAESARAAHEALLAEAAVQGWDEEEINKAYIDRRFAMIDDLVAAKDGPGADAELREWAKEFRELDSLEFRKQVGGFAKAYTELGRATATLEDKVAYFDKAKEFTSDAAGKAFLDKEAGSAYKKAHDKCVADNPTDMSVCDAYREQAEARASAIGEALAQYGTEQQVQAHKAAYIRTFGGGPTVSMPGLGTLAPQSPGEFDAKKIEAYRQQMQQMQMNQMMGLPPGGVAKQPASLF